YSITTAPAQDPEWPGPRYDHTTEMFGGGYLYLTAFRSIGTFTQLVSKVISGPRPVNPIKTYCLSMWTRLNSADLEMRLHLVRFGDGWADSNRTKQIFSVGGVNQ